MSDAQPTATAVQQPVTDDSIQVRHLSHYPFSWVAGEAGAPAPAPLMFGPTPVGRASRR